MSNFHSLFRPILFAAAYQLRGIGKIAPFYFLLSTWTTSSRVYNRTAGRPVPEGYARAILPGVVIAYAVPTVLMFLPYSSIDTWQDAIALWQFAPLAVGPLVFALGRALAVPDPDELEMYKNRDVAPLRAAYALGVGVTGVVHVCVVLFALAQGVRLGRIFGVENPFSGKWPSDGNPLEEIFQFFKWDLASWALVTLVWCLWSVFDMRRLGYVTTGQALRAAVAVPASLLALGPGAMYAGTWYWREGVISELCK